MAENAAFERANVYEERIERVADERIDIRDRLTDAEVTLHQWNGEEQLTLRRIKDQTDIPFSRLMDGSRKERTVAKATSTLTAAERTGIQMQIAEWERFKSDVARGARRTQSPQFSLPVDMTSTSTTSRTIADEHIVALQRQLDEPNAFEFDIELTEKPDTNVFTYELEGWEDLHFAYQSPDWCDLKEVECPENVIGSYAVYHLNKVHNEHGTGKLYHIYRPLILDAAGRETWGQLVVRYTEPDGVTPAPRANAARAFLDVVAPEEFLGPAQYPVIIDPTFGFTGIGGSAITLGASSYNTSGASLGSDISGTVTSLHGYFRASSASGATWRLALNNDTGGVPGATAHLASSYTGMTNTSYQLMTYSAATYEASGEDLWVRAEGNYNGGQAQIAGDTSGGSGTNAAARLDFGSWSLTGVILSVYATYEESEPEAKVASRSRAAALSASRRVAAR